MGSVIDFGIRISQKLTGDDAVGKLAKLEQNIGKSTSTIAKMEEKLGSARKALAALMDGGSGGKSVNLAAVEKMRDTIAKLEGDLGKKKGGLEGLMGGLGDAKNAASAQKMATEAMAKMKEADAAAKKMANAMAKNVAAMKEADAAADPLNQFAALKTMATDAVKLAGPLLAVAAALVAIVSAAVVGTFALAQFSLAAANTARSEGIVMTALAGSTVAAEANAAAIDRVADSTALARTQIVDIGKRLAVAGIDGQRFETTLATISTATALLGASAGAHLEGIIEKSKALGHFQFSDRQLKGLGISFGDLAAQVGMSEAAFKGAMKAGRISVEQGVDAINAAITKRFGGGGAALMLDFNVQITKLHEHLVGLVRDVNIEPFLVAMKDLLSVFDKNTVTGEALHFVFTKVFDGLFAAIAKVEPFAKAFFQGFVIAALLLYIAIVKVKRVLEETFGGSTLLAGIDGITVAMYAGAAVFGLMLGIVSALTVAVLVLAGAMLLPFLPVIAVLLAMYAGFRLGESAINSFAASVGGIALPDLSARGADMIAGLVNSIANGSSLFSAAMLALGQAGLQALNSIFHFGSPSKEMEQRGEWIDEGGAKGVENQGAMRRAMGGMASPVDVGAKGGKGDASRVAYITIQVGGASKEERKSLLAEMADALEEAGIMVGFGATPEPA